MPGLNPTTGKVPEPLRLASLMEQTSCNQELPLETRQLAFVVHIELRRLHALEAQSHAPFKGVGYYTASMPVRAEYTGSAATYRAAWNDCLGAVATSEAMAAMATAAHVPAAAAEDAARWRAALEGDVARMCMWSERVCRWIPFVSAGHATEQIDAVRALRQREAAHA